MGYKGTTDERRQKEREYIARKRLDPDWVERRRASQRTYNQKRPSRPPRLPYSEWSEERRQLQRDRAKRHWDKVRADPERWRTQLDRAKEWRKEHPESHRAGLRRDARKRHEYLSAIKLAEGCIDCGYRAAPEALHFDHVDPSTKAASIAAMISASRARLATELAKCVVRCANCHAVRTEQQRRERWGPK